LEKKILKIDYIFLEIDYLLLKYKMA